MKASLVLGVLAFVFGLGMALVSMTSATGVAGAEGSAWNVIVPVLGGLSMALGGLLMGLSFGNWRHPRSHVEPGDEIVDPEAFHKVKHV